MQEVQIPSKAGVLQGTIFHSDNVIPRQPAALLIHGWTSGQDRLFELAEVLSKRSGVTCLTVDLRGHGKTEGNRDALSRKDFLDDAIAAYDFLKGQDGIDADRIGIIGSSFGGCLAALLTSKRNVSWVVLRAPADYPDEDFVIPQIIAVVRKDANEWRRQERNWQETAALRAIHEFRGKILIVESEKDDIVPQQTVMNYKNAVSDDRNLKYVVMKSAPHSLTRYPELKKEFNEIVFDWEKNKSNIASTQILP